MTRFEQMRLDARMSQKGLAEATGVPVRTIRNLEAGGVQSPTVDTAGPLADFFGMSVSDFVLLFREPQAA